MSSSVFSLSEFTIELSEEERIKPIQENRIIQTMAIEMYRSAGSLLFTDRL